jgi:hypothetical protein
MSSKGCQAVSFEEYLRFPAEVSVDCIGATAYKVGINHCPQSEKKNERRGDSVWPTFFRSASTGLS